MRHANPLILILVLPLARVGPGCDETTAVQSDGGVDLGPGTDGATDGGGVNDTGITASKAPKRVSCNNPALTPPATGTCTATKGTSGSLLLQGTVLAPDTVYANGVVLVDSAGKITCVGCDCASGYSGATRVECARGVISPGLINPHDHMGWTVNQPNPPADTVRYDHRHEWRIGKNGKPKLSSGSSNTKTVAMVWGELRMIIGGATSIMGASTGASKLLRNLDGKTEGLAAAVVTDSTFPLGDSDGSMCKGTASCYTLPSAATVKTYKAWLPHVAEGGREEAHNEFLAVSGQLSGTTSLLGSNAAFIHSVGLTARDAQKMAAAQAKVIWSPRSNICLYGYTARVVLMDNLGVQIALGTDWIPSGSMNMLRELACADYLNEKHYAGHFKPYDLWAMATANAADATGTGAEIGRLKVGSWADIAVFDGADLKSSDWPHLAVVRADVADVALVLRAGTVLHGDTALVKVLDSQGGTGCEALDSCLAGKSICSVRESTYSIAKLKTEIGGTPYPLYFCSQTPDKEPTCVPLRPGEYNCKQSDAADLDCDGVKDTVDNCSGFHNAVWLMDSGKQPNSESGTADAFGDECDACPFDNPNTSPCTTAKPDPNDLDGDGVPNATDNCPNIANKDQKDTDSDKIGDACDACPTYANPAGAACALTLKELRNSALGKRPADGTTIKVAKVIITSLPGSGSTTKGFYVREGTAAYEAFYIYTGVASPQKATDGTTLKLGDEVSVEGQFKVYYNIDELEKPTSIKVTKASTGTPAPVALKTADLTAGTTAEKWESHLVRVSNVTVAVAPSSTDDNFWVTDGTASACTGKGSTCTQVGDFYFDGGTTDGKPDNNGAAFKAGAACTSITGIVNGYSDDHTLDPGSASDLVCK